MRAASRLIATPGVWPPCIETSLDAARMSACATQGTGFLSPPPWHSQINHPDQRIFRLHRRRTRMPRHELVVQRSYKLLDLRLHLPHLLAHVENDLDPGQVHA